MTPAAFRRLALALPEAAEGEHMGHADFRVGGKIFATLGADDRARGVVKLTPEQQELFMRVAAASFVPAAGSWGRRGWTTLHLRDVRQAWARDALAAAWRNVAPKRLAAMHADADPFL